MKIASENRYALTSLLKVIYQSYTEEQKQEAIDTLDIIARINHGLKLAPQQAKLLTEVVDHTLKNAIRFEESIKDNEPAKSRAGVIKNIYAAIKETLDNEPKSE